MGLEDKQENKLITGKFDSQYVYYAKGAYKVRDIKFRGFNDGIGWVYGMYVDGFIVDDVIEATDEYIALGRWCPVDIDSVGQYADVKDKNGVEIYEGDIYKSPDKNLFTVVWHKEGLQGLFLSHRSYKGEEYTEKVYEHFGNETEDKRWGVEVIGNIYENPEIVK